MKVDIAKINDTILRLEEVVPAKDWGMDSPDVKFVDDIRLSGEFSRIDKEILVNADIVLDREITCSRCLKHCKQTIKQNFKKSYDSSILSEDLDIDGDLREEILVNFPMKVLCKDDCKGLCSVCGADLNLNECKCKSH